MTRAERASLRLWTVADLSPDAFSVTPSKVEGRDCLVVWIRRMTPAHVKGLADFDGFSVRVGVIFDG